MNLEYFDYVGGLRMTSPAFDRLFGGPPREPETPLTQREMDLARSIQEVTEEIVLRMARHVRRETGERDLCLAGGVALNCVANGKLLRAGHLRPALDPAGGGRRRRRARRGATSRTTTTSARRPGRRRGGTRCAAPSSARRTTTRRSPSSSSAGARPATGSSERALLDAVAGLLAEGKVVGWFQGRMEFGPRALGNRSILGDPRSPDMQKRMNLEIKFREGFRPFAPAVLAEKAARVVRDRLREPVHAAGGRGEEGSGSGRCPRPISKASGASTS